MNRLNGSDLKVNVPAELANDFLWGVTATMRRNGQEIQDAMIDGMIRLEAALRPHIDRLPA